MYVYHANADCPVAKTQVIFALRPRYVVCAYPVLFIGSKEQVAMMIKFTFSQSDLRVWGTELILTTWDCWAFLPPHFSMIWRNSSHAWYGGCLLVSQRLSCVLVALLKIVILASRSEVFMRSWGQCQLHFWRQLPGSSYASWPLCIDNPSDEHFSQTCSDLAWGKIQHNI